MAIAKFICEKGNIEEDRISFENGEDGEPNVFVLQAHDWEPVLNNKRSG